MKLSNSLIVAVHLPVMFLLTLPAHGQHTLDITKIKTGRDEVASAGVSVTAPGKKTTTMKVEKGTRFDTGTRIGTPDSTTLYFETGNGNKIQINPNSTLQMASSDKGETYTVTKGKIIFEVVSKLDFFNAKDGASRIQGAVKGTVFSAEIVGKQMKFVTMKGAVEVQRKVPVEIRGLDEGPPAKIDHQEGGRERLLTTVKTEQVTEDSGEKSYHLDEAADKEHQFDSLADALSHFEHELANARSQQDLADVADHQTTIGYLYLEQHLPEKAIVAFENALRIHAEFFPDMVNPALADDYTHLGHASQDLGDLDTAFKYFQQAYEVLEAIDPEDPHIAELFLDVAEVLMHVEKPPPDVSAEEIVDDAIEILEFDLEVSHANLDEALAIDDDMVPDSDNIDEVQGAVDWIMAHFAEDREIVDPDMAWVAAHGMVDDTYDLAWAYSLKAQLRRAAGDFAEGEEYQSESDDYLRLSQKLAEKFDF